jgi:protein phosphatase inhibitor 2
MDADDDCMPSSVDAEASNYNPNNTPQRAVKPAIKKAEQAALKERERHLKWDEAAIEEHDQLRGTRMRIDEPNTPYTHYDSGAESDDSRRPKSPMVQKDSISWDTLQTRLDSVAAVRDAFPSSPSSHGASYDTDQGAVSVSVDDHNHNINSSSGDDGGQGEHRNELRDLEFREHRRRHYNEFELVKKYRAEHPEGALSSDDDIGDITTDGDDADDENDE